jgi:pimeloyl-ACP methyl ester carboxylesterase
MTPMPVPVELPDGRSVDVYVDGPSDGVPLVSHHGTPGAGVPYGPFVRAAAERGMRWVSYSRPGYASSTRAEGRAVADCVADVVAILDHLGAGRFYATGGSGGGPHSLACAALVPDRVLACTAVASVAPRDAAGLDWSAGMGPENIEEFGAAETGPDALERFLERDAQGLREATSADELIETMAGLLPPVDREALSGDYAEATIESMHRSVSTGIWGWFDDDMAFLKDWGFSLGAIEAPVAVWQGRHDKMVPFGHGEWLAAHTAGARPRLLDDHGHLSIAVTSFDRVLDDLLEMEKERA